MQWGGRKGGDSEGGKRIEEQEVVGEGGEVEIVVKESV